MDKRTLIWRLVSIVETLHDIEIDANGANSEYWRLERLCGVALQMMYFTPVNPSAIKKLYDHKGQLTVTSNKLLDVDTKKWLYDNWEGGSGAIKYEVIK